MFSNRANHWGWGLHMDLKGNVKDAFAGFQKKEEKPEAQAEKKPSKWHVKKHPKKALMAAR